jgi:malonyl-CoA O-methyltransferase
MNLPEKHRIRAAFSRAATTYDAASVLQREVCHALLDALTTTATCRPADILDAGCGTGYGARLLASQWPSARLAAADFAATMAQKAASAAPACVADIEALPFRAAAFDLWWSSLTVQWCDAQRIFAEAARVLQPQGQLALSTLGPGTYAELRDAFAGIDRHRHTLDFSEPAPLTAAAEAAGFADLQVTRRAITLHYPDLKALLGAVKAIGANALGTGRRSGMMGKAAWQALTNAYEAQRTAEGLPASYDVILLTARK